MRFLIALLILIPAQAVSLKDFDAKPGPEQSAYIVNFIDKMASDIGAKNPQLAAGIRDYFSRRQEGKPVSEGMERLFVELTAIDLRAKDGKADPSKIELESVIVWVVKPSRRGGGAIFSIFQPSTGRASSSVIGSDSGTLIAVPLMKYSSYSPCCTAAKGTRSSMV